METRTHWVVIAVAIGFAVLAIALALYWGGERGLTPDTGSLAGAQGGSVTSGTEEWRSILSTIAERASTQIGEYRAPEELGTTESISQELLVTYAKLKSENKLNTPEADEELRKLLERNITPVQPNDSYTLASVVTSQSVTLDEYAGSVGRAMEKSAAVKEYELATFARTVGTDNFRGTPELKAVAAVYRTIERDLVRAPVPPALAEPHLAVVENVAFLAQATELMAAWSGDPVDALSYVDAFVKAERSMQTAFNTLFTAMVEFGKQS